MKSGRKNADECDGASIDVHGASERAWIGAEVAVPEAVGNDGHIRGARRFFFGKKIAAELGRNPKDMEEILRDAVATDRFGFAFGDQAKGRGIERGARFEGMT